MVGFDTFFTSQSRQLGALTLRHAVPAIAPYREFAVAGGLMSYGTNITDMYRQLGVYTGRRLPRGTVALAQQRCVGAAMVRGLRRACRAAVRDFTLRTSETFALSWWRVSISRLGGWRLTGPLHVHLFAGDPRQRHDVIAPNRARRVEEDAARDRVRKIQNELAVVGFDLAHTGIVLLSYNSDGNTTRARRARPMNAAARNW